MGWHMEGDKPVRENGPMSGDDFIALRKAQTAYYGTHNHDGGGFLGDIVNAITEGGPAIAMAALAVVTSGASLGLTEAVSAAASATASGATAAEAFTASELAANAATSAAYAASAGEVAAGGAAAGAGLAAEGAAGGAAGEAAAGAAAEGAGGAAASAEAGASAGFGGGGAAAGADAGAGAGAEATAGFGGGSAGGAAETAQTAQEAFRASELAATGGTSAAAGEASAGAAAAGNGSMPSFGQLAQYGKTGLSALSALAGSAAGPAIGTGLSGLIGANGARSAAQTQADSATQAIALQQGMFDKSQGNLQPYINGGQQAMGQLTGKLADGSLGGTFSGADYLANKDPGYQFQLDQGNQALQNSQASKDGVLGGSSLKGLIDYNQGMASTGYQSAYNRWLQSQQNTYGQLSGAASLGASSANAGAQSAGIFSKSIGDNITGRGNSLAAGQVGVANNYGRSIDGIANRLYALKDFANPSVDNSPVDYSRGAPSMGSSAFDQTNAYNTGSDIPDFNSNLGSI